METHVVVASKQGRNSDQSKYTLRGSEYPLRYTDTACCYLNQVFCLYSIDKIGNKQRIVCDRIHVPGSRKVFMTLIFVVI